VIEELLDERQVLSRNTSFHSQLLCSTL